MPPGNADASVQESILRLCRKFPEGIDQAKMHKEMPNVHVDDLANAMNKLLGMFRIKAFHRVSNKELVYVELPAEEASKLKSLSNDDRMILDFIKESNQTGIWTRDLRLKTSLQTGQVSKIVKSLESKKLIKAVRSVHNGNKKVYMGYDVEPSKEVTGGAWYTESEFDSEFIDALRNACVRVLQQKAKENKDGTGGATLDDLHRSVMLLGIAKVELRPEDMQQILSTLMHDGKVEIASDENQEFEFYRIAKHSFPKAIAFTSVPCGSCPVIHECTPGGAVSPEACVYYDAWIRKNMEDLME